MGTRNLTMVISNGKTKVAQYGQWDGYPGGQGLTILEFLKKADISIFKDAVKECKFLSQKEIDKRYKDVGITGNTMNMKQAEDFKAANPSLDRDMAAEVLEAIYNGRVRELQDNSSFAADSLFCEWAYVVDLDSNKLEVYEGFNKTSLTENDRFFKLQKEGEEYNPVKLVASFDISTLPEQQEFIAICEPQEEEEEY